MLGVVIVTSVGTLSICNLLADLAELGQNYMETVLLESWTHHKEAAC